MPPGFRLQWHARVAAIDAAGNVYVSWSDDSQPRADQPLDEARVWGSVVGSGNNGSGHLIT